MACWIGGVRLCGLNLFGFLMTSLQVCQANPSQEFIVTLPQNDNATKESRAFITPWTTTDNNVQVEVYTLDGRIHHSLVLRNGRGKEVKLHPSLNFPTGSLRSNNYTLRVEASNNVTVIIRSLGNTNHDTYMARPVSHLGTEYVAVSYAPLRKRGELPFCFVVVAAASSFANVNITLPIPSERTNPRRHFLVFENVTYIPGDVIVTSLEPYEAVQIQAPFDLTGALIVSDAPVAAWSGVNRTKIEESCWSHVLSMLPPTSHLGIKYVLAPAPIETPRQDFRIVASDWSTRIRIYQSGDVSPIRHILPRPGSYVQYTSTNQKEYAYLEASKAVIVALYLSSSTETNKGDASMNVLMSMGSVEQSYYRFFLTRVKNTQLYMSIILEKGREHNFTLNGDPLASHGGVDSLETYDVEHRNDLIVLVANMTQDTYLKTYDLRHTDGVTFLVYMARVSNCEGQLFSVGYSHLVYSPVDPQNQVPRRCQAVDRRGESLVTLQEIVGENKCCVREAEECDCSVTRSKHKCFLLDEYRIADDMIPAVAPSLLRCQQQCHAHPLCNGINYGQDAEPAARCQLLIGQFYGLTSNGVHGFLYCRSKIAMKFGGSCTS